jgi:hypothetical protein
MTVEALLFRIAVALLTVQAFRDELEKRGNVYSGAMSPNLTSISDVLTLPDLLLREQVEKIPQLQVTPEMLAQLRQMLA